MANQVSSIASQLPLLKNYYGPGVISQFSDAIPAYANMEKGAEKYVGSKVVRALKVRRNQGIGATAERGTLPALGKQTVINAEIQAKFHYLRVGITAQMIAASKTDRGAFASDFSFEMQEGLNDFKNDFNRCMFWDGSGTLATVAANAVSSNVITATGRTSSEAGNKYIDVGMVIDIVSSGVVVASSVGVTAVSGTTTATITLATPVTVSATDIIVRAGSYNLEMQGFLTSQDGATSTIYNVDRSTYSLYQGNSINALGAQLNLALMQQAFNEARRRGDSKVDLVLCDFDTE